MIPRRSTTVLALLALLALLVGAAALVLKATVLQRPAGGLAAISLPPGQSAAGLLADQQTGQVLVFTAAAGSGSSALGWGPVTVIPVFGSRPNASGQVAQVSVSAPNTFGQNPGSGSAPTPGGVDLFAPGSATLRLLANGVYAPSLAVVDDTASRLVLADQAGGDLTVVDMASGRRLQSFPLGATPVAVTADTWTGRVFVASFDETMDVVDTRGGAPVRVVSTRPPPLPGAIPIAGATVAAVLDGPRGHVLVLDFSTPHTPGGVVVLDSRDGHMLRTIAVGPAPRALVVDEARAHAFVVRATGIDMLDTRRLTLLRTTPISHFAPSVPRYLAALASYSSSRVAVTTLLDERLGRLFVATGSGTVYVVDTASGRLMNTLQLTGFAAPGRFGLPGFAPIPLALLADDRTGRLIVLGYNGATMVDARNGAVTGSFNVGNMGGTGANTSPAFLGATSLATPGVAVDPRTGQLLVTSQGPSHAVSLPGSSVPVQVFDGPGSVDVLDGRNGALIRALPAGLTPGAIAVDERGGRAFVLDEGGAVMASDPWAWLPGWLRGRVPFLPPANPPPRVVPPGIDIVDLPR